MNFNEFQSRVIEGEEFNLEFSHIGEGHQGEYDSEDPSDEPLIRLSLMDKNNQYIDDGSYCTQLNTNLSEEDVQRVANFVFHKLSTGGKSPKKNYGRDVLAFHY